MDRLEKIRAAVDDLLRQQQNPQEGRCGFVHLYGVATICALLALKRGLDAQICATAGMLHDISTYTNGDPADHARLSALAAEKLLRESDAFSSEEITSICNAISHHGDKEQVHDDLAELLKDSDVLQHYLYNPSLEVSAGQSKRLSRVLEELSIS